MLHIEGQLQSISDIGNLVATVKGFYPCQVGESVYTIFKPIQHFEAASMEEDSPYPEWDMTKPKWDGYENISGVKVGMVHTHHDLGSTEFSAQDMDELDDNVNVYGLYISLVVDFSGRFTAKGCFEVESSEKIITKQFGNISMESNQSVKKLVIFDFEIDTEIEDWFVDKLEECLDEQQARIISENKNKAAKKLPLPSSTPVRDIRKTTALNPINGFKKHQLAEISNAGYVCQHIPGVGNIYHHETNGKSYLEDGTEIDDAKFDEITSKMESDHGN